MTLRYDPSAGSSFSSVMPVPVAKRPLVTAERGRALVALQLPPKPRMARPQRKASSGVQAEKCVLPFEHPGFCRPLKTSLNLALRLTGQGRVLCQCWFVRLRAPIGGR